MADKEKASTGQGNSDKGEEKTKKTKKDFSDLIKDDNDAIARNMQYQRILNKKSQQFMANTIHVSREYISKVESGTYKVPAYLVKRYCEILKVPPDLILHTHVNTKKSVMIRDAMDKFYNLPEDVLQSLIDIATAYFKK